MKYLYHKLQSWRLTRKARDTRSEAAKAYRHACRKASWLDHLARRHTRRISGRKFLAGVTTPQVVKEKRGKGLSLAGIRGILSRVQLVQQ